MSSELAETKNINAKGSFAFSDSFLGWLVPQKSRKDIVPMTPPTVNALPPQRDTRMIEDTILLLKRAQNTIEKAERIISEQTVRIQNLEDMNTVDELTGFLNPRGFERAFQRERQRLAADQTRSGMIVLIEMENFDFVQSKFGARTADACLKLMSRILRDEIREMDSVGRMKKSEFALLFTGSAADIALDRTQKLAMRVNSLNLPKGRERIPISASIRLQDFSAETQFYSLF